MRQNTDFIFTDAYPASLLERTQIQNLIQNLDRKL